jgi:putative chitinase
MIVFERTIFFDAVRGPLFNGALSQKQVDGMEAILSTWEEEVQSDDLRWLAYMLATTYHETAFTMQPITEYGSESYLKGKSYYPYIGRGFVQLTWKDNYARATTELGLSGEDDLVDYPDRALDLQIASDVMFQGMAAGWFTGKKLADYFNATVDDPYNARRIINGTDCAEQIKGYHNTFLSALKDSVTEYIEPIPEPVPETDIPTVTITIDCDDRVRVVVKCGPNAQIVS